VRPEVLAYDLHPEYLSTKYVIEREDVRSIGIQHHHAHLAACLAEHGERGPAVGAIFDGSVRALSTPEPDLVTVKAEGKAKNLVNILDPNREVAPAYIAFTIETKDDDWFATVVHLLGSEEKGLAFFRELVEKNGISARHGHTLLTNMVVSGEVPLALTVYNYMPEQAKKKGAPIDWFAIEPAVARSNAIGVARKAPHPNAALLFYEYLLGPDGQHAMVSVDYVPTNTKIASPLKDVKIVQTDPIRSLDESGKWSKLFEDIVVKQVK